MKRKNENNGKYKFPVEIKGDLELPDIDLSENFNIIVVKKKMSSEVKEIKKNKKTKCQSSKLI